MKIPKTIKVIGVVDKKNPKINVFDIFTGQNREIGMTKNETKCILEIKFIKYTK